MKTMNRVRLSRVAPIALIVGTVVFALLGPAAPGSAATVPGSQLAAPAKSGKTHTFSPAEEKALLDKLSPAQEKAVQSEIDMFLKNSKGGKQINAFEISFDNGDTILTVPPPGINASYNCRADLQEACVYKDTWFNGAYLHRSPCGRLTLSSYGFQNNISSIWNAQTSGTQTMLLNTSLQIVHADLAPSRVNDLGVYAGNQADYWEVC